MPLNRGRPSARRLSWWLAGECTWLTRPFGTGPAQDEGAGSKACLAKGVPMLYYALMFLLIALIAGVLGFGVVAFAAAEVARIFFFIFVVLFLVSLLSHLFRRANNS